METNPVIGHIIHYLLMLAIALVIFGLGWFLYWLRNIRTTKVIGTEVKNGQDSALDYRSPVLYLRNFSVDGSKINEVDMTIPKVKFNLNLPTLETRDINLNEENFLRRKVAPLGPLRSIGAANIHDIGINRILSSELTWQNTVESLMIESRMIILRTSSRVTPGVKWELEMILSGFLFKTLFFVEHNNSEMIRELDMPLKLKFPGMVQTEITDRIVPYYMWVDENGKKNYSTWLRWSGLYKKLLKELKELSIPKPPSLYYPKW